MPQLLHKCCICITSPSLVVVGEHGKRHTIGAHLPEAVSNWLNPLSLGTMSASGYFENLASNSTCLNNSQELII